MNLNKNRLGVLFPIIATFALCIGFFSLSRLFLVLWQWERVAAADGLLTILISGLRVDISTLCSLMIIPALVSCLVSSDTIFGRAWHYLLRIWITFVIWLIVYMEFVTVPFIIEYDLRPNRLFIEYF